MPKTVKKSIIFSLAILLSILALNSSYADEKTGLLIITHGSKNPAWKERIIQLGDILDKKIMSSSKKIFAASSVSFLEMAMPDIQEGIENLEKKGITKIVAIPLFICESEHTSEDIPAVLGLKDDEKKLEELKAEGIRMVKTNSTIILGKPLNEGPILEKRVLEIMKSASENPNNERLVMLAHGSEKYRQDWTHLMDSLSTAIKDKIGIQEIDYAFVEVGQTLKTEATKFIEKRENKKEVLILGVYLGFTAENIKKRQNYQEPAGISVKWIDEAILKPNDEAIADWLIDYAGSLL